MNCSESGCGGTVLADGYCDTCGTKSSAAANTPSVGSVASGTVCNQPGCGGTVSADGYCDTCGSKQGGASASPSVASSSVASPNVASSSSSGSSPANLAGSTCAQPGCGGTVSADGYCDTCGMAASTNTAPSSGPISGSSGPVSTFGMAVAPTTSRSVAGAGTATAASRSVGQSTRTSRVSQGVGAGLVTITPTPEGDPSAAIMSPAKVQAALGIVPPEERHCTSCGKLVGQPSGDKPGRVKGFCGECRTAFDFVTNEPNLAEGELVAGQYEILGPMAHGGLGWIYLGRDRAVSNRWVVLKGLLNEDDADAVAAAVAERQFLAQLNHANIVNIYNFVTHKNAGYIVMEMIGGESLTSKLKDRRAANNGIEDPLPPAEAIAYILGILPALAYLHSERLVYNDLKPANIMAVGDEVKLIDLGAVMHMDDPEAAIFGTQGFQAPEMATMGPSASSDLYTVGRTLAVMIIRFVYHTGQYLYSIPTPHEEPLFAQHESLYRFLLRATAQHPDDRFQTADEMAEQLMGILREIASINDGVPRQYTSSNFEVDQLADLLVSGVDDIDPREADWRVLPSSRVNADDPTAPFLDGLPEADARRAITAIQGALESEQIPANQEVLLHLVREAIHIPDTAQTNHHPQSEQDLLELNVGKQVLVSKRRIAEFPELLLAKLEADNPWDWRVDWYRAVIALRDGDPVKAAEGFSEVWTELPGETAPKVALAAAAEQAQDYARAAELYDLVTRTDSSFVSASFGLARCYWELGRPADIVGALERVPSSSAAYYDAQIAAAQAQIYGGPSGDPSIEELESASVIMQRLKLDAAQRANLAADIYKRALSGIQSGRIHSGQRTLLDAQLDPQSLRQSLSETYREQARLTNDDDERIRLIDAANEIRPRTFI